MRTTAPTSAAFESAFGLTRFTDLPDRFHTALNTPAEPAKLLENLMQFSKSRPMECKTPDQRHSFKSNDGSFLGADVYLPHGPSPQSGWPCAVLLHGGAFLFGKRDISHIRIVSDDLNKRGIATISIDYRKIPHTHAPWRWSFWKYWMEGNLKHAVDDAATAIDWIHQNGEKFGLDPHLLHVAGFSSGSLIAELAAAKNHHKVSSLTVFYGPHAPLAFQGWVGRLLRFGLYGAHLDEHEKKRYMPLSEPYVGPTFIIHGTRDTLTPAFHAWKLAHNRFFRGLETYLHLEEGAPHGYMNDPASISSHTHRSVSYFGDFIEIISRRQQQLGG